MTEHGKDEMDCVITPITQARSSAYGARASVRSVPGRWGRDPYAGAGSCRGDVDCPPDKLCEHGRCV